MRKASLKLRLLPPVFMGILFFPFLNGHFSIIPDKESMENRALAEEPVFDVSYLDPYPQAYEAYYNDHFSLRNYLTNTYSWFTLYFFQESPLPEKCIVGNDGWLYIGDKEMEVYSGRKFFKSEELDLFRKELELRRNYLGQMGCSYYVVIAPIKQSIYPEFLPSGYQRKSTYTRTDQLLKFLNEKSEIKVIDLRQSLLDAKPKYQLFKKTDNHWNSIGAYTAYRNMVEVISENESFVSPPLNIDQVNIDTTIVEGGNIAQMTGAHEIFEELDFHVNFKNSIIYEGKKRNYPVPEGFPYGWAYEIVKTTNNDSLLKLLMIRDSFGKELIPFLSAHFNESIYIFDSWRYMLNREIVDKEKPNVFIQTIIESNLDNLLENINRQENKSIKNVISVTK